MVNVEPAFLGASSLGFIFIGALVIIHECELVDCLSGNRRAGL